MSFWNKFFPTYVLPSIFELTPSLCLVLDIDFLLVDIDNTLATHNNPEPYVGAKEWVAKMKMYGNEVIIISNNHVSRVEDFAERVGVSSYIARAGKPLPDAFHRAIAAFGCRTDRTAVVGDQLLTDILGANMSGLRSVLVTKITPERGLFFRFKRALERYILSKALPDEIKDIDYQVRDT